jgi:hypothetical protein
MVDPIDDHPSVRGPNLDAYIPFYEQQNPVHVSKKGGYPYPPHDTMSSFTVPPGSVDLNTTKGVSGVGNDRKILEGYISAIGQRRGSHEASGQEALDSIMKNKEVTKITKKEKWTAEDKEKNASTISRIAGWLSWFFGGAMIVTILAGMGLSLVTGGIAAIPAVIHGVLALCSGISAATKAFFDYKVGKHKQEALKKDEELKGRQKSIQSKSKQISEENQGEKGLWQQIRQAASNYNNTVRSA